MENVQRSGVSEQIGLNTLLTYRLVGIVINVKENN